MPDIKKKSNQSTDSSLTGDPMEKMAEDILDEKSPSSDNSENMPENEKKLNKDQYFDKKNPSSGDSNSTKSGTYDQIEIKELQNEVQQKQESSDSSLKPKVMTADEYYGPKLSDEVRQNGGLMYEGSGITIMNVYWHRKVFGFNNLYALEFAHSSYEDEKDKKSYKAYIKGLRTHPQDIVRVTEGELNELTELIINEDNFNKSLEQQVNATDSLNGLEYNKRYKTFKEVTESDFEKIIDFVKNLEPRKIRKPTKSKRLNKQIILPTIEML